MVVEIYVAVYTLGYVIFGYIWLCYSLLAARRDFWASAECQAAGAQYDAADVVCEGVFVLRSVECGGWIDLGVRSAM